MRVTRTLLRCRSVACVLPIAVFGLLLFVWPVRVEAATLALSPATGSYPVGQSLTVRVAITSADQAMNAAAGIIAFPADRLEVVSLSKAGSIIGLWVQEPSFSNDAGTVTFEGVVLNPGYTGSNGTVLTIRLRAKAAGDAAVRFSTASVLANDGKGTNILAGLGSARFTIGVPVTTPPAPEATTPAGVPYAARVSSSTHPDPTKWYAEDTPKFSWALPPGTTGVNVLADRDPTTNPGVKSDGIFDSYSYEDVDEGTWFFHLRLRNALGWGAIAHFQFQIDTMPPGPFTLTLLDGEKTSNPRPRIAVHVEDTTSGIASLGVRVGDGDAVTLRPEEIAEQHPFVLGPQAPSRHTVVVQAFDRAGNVTTSTREFTVEPLPPPTIPEYPAELPEGEVLTMRGASTPISRVTVTLTTESGQQVLQEVETDATGSFELVWPERLPSGLYTFTASVTDARGAKSNSSEPRTIAVRQRAVLRVGSLAVTYLSVFISLLALVVLLVLILVYGWFRIARIRKHVRREARDAERVLHASFTDLRADVRKQVRILERVRTTRALTTEEEAIMEGLKKHLDAAEKRVQKEIKDIEDV